MLNWNYLFAGIKQRLSNPHQLLAKVILIQMIGFSKKKKIIRNKSSSLLLHLHLHLLHLLIMNKSSNLLKKKKTINQNFQFLEKIQDFQIFQTKKKLSIKIFNSLKKCKISKFEKRKNSLIKFFQIPSKIQDFQIFQKKKKFFIKFLFRNKKLWSSSIFSNGATSSQLSTLSIHRSMEYVPN